MAQLLYPAGFVYLLLLGATGAAWGVIGDGPVRESKERAAVLAMERAQKQAAHPLKAILEAAKIERKPVVPAAAVAATLPRRATVRTATSPTPPSAARETVAAAFVLPTDATSAGQPPRPSAVAVAPVPEPVPASTPASTPAPERLAVATLPAVDAPGPVQPLAQPQARTEPGAVTAPAALPLAPVGDPKVSGSVPVEPSTNSPLLIQIPTGTAAIAPPAIFQPKLVSTVQPTIALRMWDEVAPGTEISVDVNIRRDGTVAGVAFVGAVPRAFARAIQAAINQWLFEPLPAPQVHRVQLVLNPPER